MTEVATTTVLNATFGSTTAGEAILKRLTRLAGFSADNVIARLAIARSLKEASDSWNPELEEDSSGKQIRGMTLLGRHDIASALLAMIVEANGGVDSLDDLRRLVRLHWERGLRLLDAELESRDFDALLLEYLSDSGLAEDGQDGPGQWAGNPERVLAQYVVGQAAIVGALARLLEAEVSDAGIPIVKQPVVLVGPRGSGRRTIAAAIAAQSHIPFVDLAASEIAGPSRLLELVQDALTEQGYLVQPVGDSRVDVPPYVLHVESGELLTSEQIEWVRALKPDAKWHDTGGVRVRIPGGAIILGSTSPLKIRGAVNLDVTAYARDEISEILRREVGGWPLEVRRLLALIGRLNPGRTLARAEEFSTFIAERSTSGRPSETLLFQIMADSWHVDRIGLTEKDYQLLTSIASNESVVMDSETLLFLSRAGLIELSDGIRITTRGRSAIEIQQGVQS